MTKILVVDDTVGNRDLLSQLLELRGYETVTAASAEEAKQKIADEHFDLVISDYDMSPGGNGVSLAQWIADEKKGKLRVIILSGTEERIIKAENAPAYDRLRKSGIIGAYLEKPVNTEELFQACNDILAMPVLSIRSLVPVGERQRC